MSASKTPAIHASEPATAALAAGNAGQLSPAALATVLVMVTGVQTLSTYAALSLPTKGGVMRV